MALYTDRDIGITLSGELKLDSKGDLLLHQSPESHIAAANFLLKTDMGEYKPKPSLGANLGAMIGEPMTEDSIAFAEQLAGRALTTHVYNHEDVSLTILPLDQHGAMCIVEALGTYLVSGEFVAPNEQLFHYTFPFSEGDPTEQTV